MPMSVRLAMTTAGSMPGISVTELCREMQISRKTYHELRGRFEKEGADGLLPRSRRPLSSPGQSLGSHRATGLSATAGTPARHRRIGDLLRDGWFSATSLCPARARSTGSWSATAGRSLIRRSDRSLPCTGSSTTSPTDAGKSTPPAGSWPTACPCRSSTSSTTILATFPPRTPTVDTTESAWHTFCRGTAECGPPAKVLSDNGASFEENLTGGGRAGHLPPQPRRPRHRQSDSSVRDTTHRRAESSNVSIKP